MKILAKTFICVERSSLTEKKSQSEGKSVQQFYHLLQFV